MSAVQDRLAELREMVREARAMPLSSSAMINRQEVLDQLDLLDDARELEEREATEVLARRDDLIAEGEATAAEAVRQAALEQEVLASDTEVYRVAQRKADVLLTAAEADSRTLRGEAEAYIEQRFTNLEHALERTLAEVRRGIENLGVTHGFGAPADGAAEPMPHPAFDPTNDHVNDPTDGPTDGILLTGPEAG